MAGTPELQDLRDSLSSLGFIDREHSQLAGKIPSKKASFQTRGAPLILHLLFTKILSPPSS